MIDPPRQIGPDEPVNLTGCLMPWSDGENMPTLVFLRGSIELKPCIPIFTDQDKLEAFSVDFDVPFDRIKFIDDESGFLDSIPKDKFDIIYNPRKHDGKARYKLIKR